MNRRSFNHFLLGSFILLLYFIPLDLDLVVYVILVIDMSIVYLSVLFGFVAVEEVNLNEKVKKGLLSLLVLVSILFILANLLCFWVGTYLWGKPLYFEVIRSYVKGSTIVVLVLLFLLLFFAFGLKMKSVIWRRTAVYRVGSLRIVSMLIVLAIVLRLSVNEVFNNSRIPSVLFTLTGRTGGVILNSISFDIGLIGHATSSFDNQRRRNVILITIDALRADHLKMYGYSRNTTPFLSNLYEQGDLHKIDLAISSSNTTLNSLPTIFSGQLLGHINHGTILLPDVLSHYGYKNKLYLTGVHTDWYGLANIYGNDFSSYFESARVIKKNKGIVSSNDNLIVDELGKLEQAKFDTDYFFYFHLMSTHRLGIVEHEVSPFKSKSINLKEARINSYDNGIYKSDRIISEIFDKLKSNKYLQDAIVIITSDHGQSLGENNKYGHGNNEFIFNEFNIPILIHDNFLEIKNRQFGTHDDIAPTILEGIGITKPSVWQGESFYKEFKARQRKYFTNSGFYSQFIDIDTIYRVMPSTSANLFSNNFTDSISLRYANE